MNKWHAKNGRTYIGGTTYLTERGETFAVVALFTIGVASLLLLAGLVNVNLFTPDKCRDGLLSIKNTAECQVYMEW